MPASEASLRLTDAYGARLRRLREAITTRAMRAWSLNAADLDASFERWLPDAVSLVTFGQSEAVLLSNAYLASYLGSELGETVRTPGLDPSKYAGSTRDGRPLADVLALPLVSVKKALMDKRPMAEAIATGRARAERATRTEVVEAGRGALSDAMHADERITGYRRVVHSGHPCGACLGLAGQRRGSSEGLLIHAGCGCTAEPIVEGVKERVTRPDGKATFDSMTTAQQDRLFAGRGGADKADLIRSGSATLSDLVSTAEGPEWGLQIFETPLEALAS